MSVSKLKEIIVTYQYRHRNFWMEVNIKIIETTDEKAAVLAIRRTVFIEEQNIPEYIEIDVNEEKANYILAYVKGQPVGTARWRVT